MNKENSTLKYYNLNAAEYAEETYAADMSKVLEKFLEGIPPGKGILDLGCGAGRDSKYLLGKGYLVTAVDGSPELCRIAKEYIGIDTRCMLFEDLDYVEEFDGIWACSSLHHLYRKDLKNTLKLVFRSLKPGGNFYTCFKYGEYDFDDEKGRHFTCVTEDTVGSLFSGLEDKESIEAWISGDTLKGRDLCWVNVIVRKKG